MEKMIEQKVILQTGDGQEVEVAEEVAIKSHFIKSVIDDSGIEDKIPLPNVKLNILKKVLEYCEYHKKDNPPEIEKPLKSPNLADVVCQWDVKYIDIENTEEIFEIVLAANYLHITSLMELACAKIASLIKGKTTEEIRSTFNIVNDFTKEEEDQIRDENRWAEESN